MSDNRKCHYPKCDEDSVNERRYYCKKHFDLLMSDAPVKEVTVKTLRQKILEAMGLK